MAISPTLAACASLLAFYLQSPPSPNAQQQTQTNWCAEIGYPSFGTVVSSIGDVNADGVPDFVIGDEGFPPACPVGLAWIVSGRDGKQLVRVSADASSKGGLSLGALSDIDGDKVGDLAMGFDFQEASPGTVVVLSGKSGKECYRLHGPEPGSGFGSAVCGVGDIDHDGCADLFIGAPLSAKGAGSAFLYSGKTGALLREVRPGSGGSQFGAALASLGDVNGDGVDDLIVAQGAAVKLSFQARVLSGKDGAVLYDIARGEDAASNGVCVRPCGDIDHDGVSDFVIGLFGFVEVLSGKDGKVLWSIEGPKYDWFGNTLAVLREGKQRSLHSIAISAQMHAVGTGRVSIYSWKDKKLAYELEVKDVWQFGAAIESIGDVDADGIDDLCIGTNSTEAHDPGRALVYSGKDGKKLFEFERKKDDVHRIE